VILGFDKPAMRFLVCGGLAAAVNWFGRMLLSLVLPFTAAVVAAYAVGMVAGFVLYRRYVWPQTSGALAQAPMFILVNLVGAAVVLAVTLAFKLAIDAAMGPSLLGDAFAHGSAIAVGAFANFVGHDRLTFARR